MLSLLLAANAVEWIAFLRGAVDRLTKGSAHRFYIFLHWIRSICDLSTSMVSCGFYFRYLRYTGFYRNAAFVQVVIVYCLDFKLLALISSLVLMMFITSTLWFDPHFLLFSLLSCLVWEKNNHFIHRYFVIVTILRFS